MRKIFLDLGANDGCSVKLFNDSFPDANEYEIYCFEPSSKYRDGLLKLTPNVFTGLAYIRDGEAEFDGWSMFNKTQSIKVPCVDFSQWVISHFDKDDYIVMKIDVEGAEYEIIHKMSVDGSLSYINEMYGELHSIKVGLKKDHDDLLLDELDEHGLKMRLWDAQPPHVGISEEHYTREMLATKFYPMWYERMRKR